MFIDKDSLQISNDGTNYISLGQYLIEAQFSYNKLYGDDTGRNLSGKFMGTLIGVFPKIVVTFKQLNKNEMNIIAPILDNPTQYVKYYDPNKNTTVTMQTYTGDYTGTVSTIGKLKGIQVSFISISKRS